MFNNLNKKFNSPLVIYLYPGNHLNITNYLTYIFDIQVDSIYI